MSNTPSARVGANVRAELARGKQTQAQLAGIIGVTQSQASKRLRGAIAFNIDELAAVAKWLKVDISTLTEGAAA